MAWDLATAPEFQAQFGRLGKCANTENRPVERLQCAEL